MINFELKNKIGSEVPQSGRSMIEMLGVLAIIGVLSVGGIAGYSKAMMKYRINKSIEQITLISSNIRSFFGQQKNYSEVNCSSDYTASGCYGVSGIDSSGNITTARNGCPIIKKAKIFPDEMLTLDSTGKKIMAITNPFGYEVGIGRTSKSTQYDYQAFDITYHIVDNTEACIELMTQDWSAANVKAISLRVSYNHYYFKTPVAVDTAVTYCSKAIAEAYSMDEIRNDYPSIYFYFDIDLSGSFWNPKPFGVNTWSN